MVGENVVFNNIAVEPAAKLTAEVCALNVREAPDRNWVISCVLAIPVKHGSPGPDVTAPLPSTVSEYAATLPPICA